MNDFIFSQHPERKKSIQWSKLSEAKDEISVVTVEYDPKDKGFHIVSDPDELQNDATSKSRAVTELVG